MVRESTQQAVDRIVGTAAVIGLSIAFIRWISNPSSFSLEGGEECKATTKSRYSWMPWWWPVIAMDRWNRKRNNRTNIGDDSNDEEGEGKSQDAKQKEEQIGNIIGDYEHQGSCHCGSITFVVSNIL